MLFKPRRIFVSHSSSDDVLATKLAEQLSARGLTAFVDHSPKTGIDPGHDWLQALRRDLGRTQAVLILVTEAWRVSPWCQAEYSTAQLLKKAIIPVIVGRVAHDNIEPALQKIILEPEAKEISPELIDAIARGLPRRLIASAMVVTALVILVAMIAMGIEKTPYGRWEPAVLRGGAFVDLVRDPVKEDRLFALAANGLGRRGLFSSPDCGNEWSEIPLPDALENTNRLDVSSEEILVASDKGLWIFNRRSRSWSQVNLEGLSADVLVAKIVPGQPHQIAYGTLNRGGVSAGAGTAASASGGALGAREGIAGGMTIIDRRSNKSRSFPYQANDFAFDPSDPTKVAVAAADAGVFLSRDGLNTSSKVEKVDGDQPLVVSFDSRGETVYVGGRNSFSSIKFPSSDGARMEVRHLFTAEGEVHDVLLAEGGQTLLATTRGLFTAQRPDGPFVLFVPPPSLRHVNKLIQCGDRTLAATGGMGVLSLSRGATGWHRALTGTSNLPVFAGVRTESFQLVSAGPSIFRSLDEAASFETVLAPDALATTMAVWEPPRSENDSASTEVLRNRSQEARASFSYTQSSILVGLGDGRIFRKAPGSATWIEVNVVPGRTERSSPEPVNSIVRSRANPKVIVATFADSSPLLSEDDGASWAPIAGLTPHEVAFALEDGRFLFSAYDVGKMYAFDPGSKSLSTGASKLQHPITGYSFDNTKKQSRVVDIAGSVFSLESSSLELTEVGKFVVGEQTNWIDLFCCDEEGSIYAGGRSTGLRRSMDNGKSWVVVETEALRSDSDISALGPGPLGRPSLYSDAGLLQATNSARVCASDVFCLTWNSAAIFTRAATIWAWLRATLGEIGELEPYDWANGPFLP